MRTYLGLKSLTCLVDDDVSVVTGLNADAGKRRRRDARRHHNTILLELLQHRHAKHIVLVPQREVEYVGLDVLERARRCAEPEEAARADVAKSVGEQVGGGVGRRADEDAVLLTLEKLSDRFDDDLCADFSSAT